jgi:tRNA dimethylallyltransferase
MALDAAVDLIKRNTRRYAKRQWTWFNHVADVTWFAPDAFAEIDAWRMRAAAH